MKVLICAAGEGSRLKKKFSPKPLVPLFGLSLIEWVIYKCSQCGFKDFVIVVGYKKEKIMKKLGDGSKLGVKIDYVVNDEWFKGNGVSVYKAKDKIKDEKFILIMADHIFTTTLLEKVVKYAKLNSHSYLGVDFEENGKDIEDATKVEVQSGIVKAIAKDLKQWDGIDTGVFVQTQEIFSALEKSISQGKYSLSCGNQILASEGKLCSVDVTGNFWVDVDDEESLKKAKSLLIETLKKPTDGPISRFINRPISARLSLVFFKYNISPNLVSLTSFLLAIISAILFTSVEYWAILLAGVFAQVSSIIDGCDGELARLKNKASWFGGMLDRIVDRYGDALIIFGIAQGIWAKTQNSHVWLVAFLALIGTLIMSYTASWYDSLISKGIYKDTLRMGRDIRLFMIFIGAVLNQMYFTLILLAMVSNLEVVRRLYIFANVTNEEWAKRQH